MNSALKAFFFRDLQKLVGKECWAVIDGTGSIISFDFGAKIPIENRVANENLSSAAQNFEAEFSLFIHCVWRVDSKENVLFGAWTEYETVRQKKIQIIGQTVKMVELFEPAFDLKVTFSNDLRLNIFCDQTNDEDKTDNYDFFTPELIYTITYNSSLETSEHDKQ